MNTDTINTCAPIPKVTHKQLRELCEKQGVTSNLFLKELIVWAVKQDAQTLVKHGIRLPLWPEDSTNPSPHK